MEYIVRNINKSFDEAKGFFQSCIMPVFLDGEMYMAFPHDKGKDRITELGGTSSALAALRIIDTNGAVSKKVSKSVSWLSKKQQFGAWQSKGFYCSHVTAGILCDLYGYDAEDYTVENAIKYIVSCYNEKEGYFYSYPSDDGIPHIYVTFICLKALLLYGKIKSVDTDKIKMWIDKGRNWDGNWGVSPCDSCSTYSHTVYALEILLMCGLSKRDLKDRYKSQIKWLSKNGISLQKKYDPEEIIMQDSADMDGTACKEIFLQHTCAATIGSFCLDFDHLISSTVILKKVLRNQYNGGWGESHNKLTMWETDANLLFLNQYKNKYIEAPMILKVLCNAAYHLSAKLVFTISGVFFAAFSVLWLINSPEQFDGLVVFLLASAILSIAGNLIGNDS